MCIGFQQYSRVAPTAKRLSRRDIHPISQAQRVMRVPQLVIAQPGIVALYLIPLVNAREAPSRLKYDTTPSQLLATMTSFV